MYIREKKNKSGKVSVQIIDKSDGKYKVVKTVGCSTERQKITQLIQEANLEIERIKGQLKINFHTIQEEDLVETFYRGIKDFRLVGPDILLSRLFDEVGFTQLKDKLFKQLVISRLENPVSKLKTVDYLHMTRAIDIDVAKIYRYMDKLHRDYIEQVKQIGYHHAIKVCTLATSLVFYDVTTVYFEAEDEDNLRKMGFSKEGKHQHPQILLGLLINSEGFPLTYEIFEGNKFEGHTMLPILETFKHKYELNQLIVVADSGLLSNKNISELEKKNYEYIVGARIKNSTEEIKARLLSLNLTDGQCVLIPIGERQKLVVSYSTHRAKKDEHNRRRGLKRLEKAVGSGKLNKKHIINRGYNKYLKLVGQTDICIDYEKFNADAKWDGLKGYLTNTTLRKDEVIAQYQKLWLIEKAFRISKTDLRIRPIFHYLKRRIESHICISFAALVIYKELERQLRVLKSSFSPEKAINIIKTIYALRIISPLTNKEYNRLIIQNENQKELLRLFDITLDEVI